MRDEKRTASGVAATAPKAQDARSSQIQPAKNTAPPSPTQERQRLGAWLRTVGVAEVGVARWLSEGDLNAVAERSPALVKEAYRAVLRVRDTALPETNCGTCGAVIPRAHFPLAFVSIVAPDEPAGLAVLPCCAACETKPVDVLVPLAVAEVKRSCPALADLWHPPGSA